MKQAFRFSSLPVNTKFEDLAGNKWIKLDEVQAAAPALPSLTKENFPTEQIVYVVNYCTHCGSEMDDKNECYRCFMEWVNKMCN